jgi:hypothetical protein
MLGPLLFIKRPGAVDIASAPDRVSAQTNQLSHGGRSKSDAAPIMGIETVKSKSGHFNWKFRFFHVDWAEIAAGAIGLVLLILLIDFRVWMTHSITPT